MPGDFVLSKCEKRTNLGLLEEAVSVGPETNESETVRRSLGRLLNKHRYAGLSLPTSLKPKPTR